MDGRIVMPQPLSPPRMSLHAEENLHLEFFLAHIEPVFAEDSNADIGLVFVALAYPFVLVVGPPVDYDRCLVDVSQPDFVAEPDDYPLKKFLERFPHVCQPIIEAHAELHRTYLRWRDGCWH